MKLGKGDGLSAALSMELELEMPSSSRFFLPLQCLSPTFNTTINVDVDVNLKALITCISLLFQHLIMKYSSHQKGSKKELSYPIIASR